MPMNTTFVTRRCPAAVESPSYCPSARFACRSWATISSVRKLREKPCLPVEQKAQLTAQPACVDTHRVPRSVSGMKTVSIAFPSPTSSSHFRVPSADWWSERTRGCSIQAFSASMARKDLARSVIAAKSSSPRWWIQRRSCCARKGFSPMSAHHATSACGSSPSRLVFALAAPVTLLSTPGSAGVDVHAGEEKRDLGLGGLGGIRAVDGVGIDAVGEVGTNGPRGRLLRVDGAHQVAVPADGGLPFEHLDHHRAGRHEIHQVIEEGPLAVHRVEGLGLGAREVHHPGRDDPQARFFEAGIDLADDVLRDGVGLDDGQGAFDCHGNPCWLSRCLGENPVKLRAYGGF